MSRFGEPLPLLLAAQNGKIKINITALETVLKKVGDRPFICLSISGKKRTGKSFILNYILRYLLSSERDKSSGNWMNFNLETHFRWRGGSQRETMGINMWSQPFEVDLQGRRVAIIIMDSQGSFDDETTLQENALIFAWCTLISSVLIFNVMRDLGEDVLQFLQFFTGYATMALNENTSDADNSPLSAQQDSFQRLLFLIRDWDFMDYRHGYYDDNTLPSGQSKNIKVDFINPKSSQPQEVQFTHKQVINSFSSTAVYAMPEPGKKLRQLDDMQDIDPDFITHVQGFVETIFSPKILVTKNIGGVEVTGNHFMRYVSAWARLFDSGEIPEIKSVYASAADLQYTIAKSIAISYYNTEMTSFIRQHGDGATEDKLAEKNNILLIEAPKMFHGMCKLGGREYVRKFEEEFPGEIEQMFRVYEQMNHANLKSTNLQKDFQKRETVMKQEIDSNKQQVSNMERSHQESMRTMQQEVDSGKKSVAELSRMTQDHKNEKDRMMARSQELEQRMVDMNAQMANERSAISSQIANMQRGNNKRGLFAAFGNFIDNIFPF